MEKEVGFKLLLSGKICCFGICCYLCNIQFGEVGEPSGPTSLFCFKGN